MSGKTKMQHQNRVASPHYFAGCYGVTLMLGLVLLTWQHADASELLFENDSTSFALDLSDGNVKSVSYKKSNNAFSPNQEIGFFGVRVDEKDYAPTSIQQQNNLLAVAFGSTGTEIDFLVSTYPQYFTVEIVGIHGNKVDSVWIGRIDIDLQDGRLGNGVAIKWNESHITGWIPLSQRVHVVPTGARVYRKHGLVGHKAAFFVSAITDWRTLISQIEKDHQIPTTSISGQPSKYSDDAQRGYLFIDLNEKNVEKAIAWAHRAALKYILISVNSWSEYFGSYQINKKNFSQGEGTLKAIVERCHKAGLKVGIHVLIDSVAKNDPIVKPVPDSRLLRSEDGSLVKKIGHYVVDLKTSLKDQIADRLAGVINRVGLDMIYFDGVGAGAESGERWRWSGDLPVAVTNRVKRDLLVQGSSFSPWSWHIYSRGACNDFATLAPKEHIDYTKIRRYYRSYENHRLPAELGWWTLVGASNSFPATTSDQVDFIGSKMMAYNIPVSVEAEEKDLDLNGRTDEMLGLLGLWEKHRLSGIVPTDVREQLKHGDWHLEEKRGYPFLYPREYQVTRIRSSETIKVNNLYHKQSLMFRLQAVPKLALPGDLENIVLHNKPNADALVLPSKNDPMPGYAVAHHVLGQTDLSRHRSLAITLQVDSDIPQRNTPVLNIQLETGGNTKFYRDYLIDIDFTGKRTIIVEESDAGRVLKKFRPRSVNYPVLRANRHFNYRGVKKVNYRWMWVDSSQNIRVRILKVEALKEEKGKFKNPTISLDDQKLVFPIEMEAGDYLEYQGQGSGMHYDENFNLLGKIQPRGSVLDLPMGESSLHFSTTPNSSVKWTSIFQGNAINAVGDK